MLPETGLWGRQLHGRDQADCDVCRDALPGRLRCAECLNGMFIDAAYDMLDYRDALMVAVFVLPDLDRLFRYAEGAE